MTDYVPHAERERRAMIRRVGTIAIALIYAASAAALAFGPPAFRWPAVIAAMVAPPLIQRFAVAPAQLNARAPAVELAILLVLSLVIGLVAMLVLGSDMVRWWLVRALGIVAALGCMVWIASWIARDPSRSDRRLALVAIVATAIALVAGAALGSPFLRWSCIGTAAAILVVLVGDASGRSTWHSAATPMRYARHDGEEERVFGHRDAILRDGELMLDRFLAVPEVDYDGYSPRGGHDAVGLALALLEELGLSPAWLADRAASIALSSNMGRLAIVDGIDRDLIRRAQAEIGYGRLRLQLRRSRHLVE